MAVQVPKEQATVVLAVDVSLSMEADDVDPTRIEAARAAARNFVELAPEELEIGLVSFAGTAVPVLAPTTDRTAAIRAIDRLALAEGTAIGEGIYTSVRLIEATTAARENADPGAPTTTTVPPDDDTDGSGDPEADDDPASAIVVLSDGETTMGRPDLDAAAAAEAARIPVSTISFGTGGGVVVIQGETIPVPANNGALQEVAETTGGEFFEAATGGELRAHRRRVRPCRHLSGPRAREVGVSQAARWTGARRAGARVHRFSARPRSDRRPDGSAAPLRARRSGRMASE
jgi:Ca-activated chloride channel family protein